MWRALGHQEKIWRGNTLEFSPKDEEELGALGGGAIISYLKPLGPDEFGS